MLYALLAVAVLSILLGFVALLKQKTYIDSATSEPSKLELPHFRLELSSQGAFRITARLPRGATFEDVLDHVDCSHPAGSVLFSPEEPVRALHAA